MKLLFASALLFSAYASNLFAAESTVKTLCFAQNDACFISIHDVNGLKIFTTAQNELKLYELGDALPENFEFQIISQDRYELLEETAVEIIRLRSYLTVADVAFLDCDDADACAPGEIVKEGLKAGVGAGVTGAVAGGFVGGTTGTFTVPVVGTVTGVVGGAALRGTVGFIGGFGGGVCSGIMGCILQVNPH